MKNKLLKTQAKTYKFRYSPLMYALFALLLALCAAGFALTTWRVIANGADDAYTWLQYILLYFVSVFLAVILIAMLIKSQYILTDHDLILQFGLIRNRYEIEKISSVHLFKGANKLAVYFDEYQTKYIVIVVKDSWYDDFVKTLLEKNEKIGFSFSTAEEEEDAKKKK